MRELLEVVLAITGALFGAAVLVGGLALLGCTISIGSCIYAFRWWRGRAPRDRGR
jgi:hypothetical protein